MASPNYKTLTYTVPAGASVEVYRMADQLVILDATAPFKVKIDNGPDFEMEAGLSIRFAAPFERIEFINATAGPNVIRFGLGSGDVRDSRLTIGGEVDTREATPKGFAALAPLTVAAGVTEAAFPFDLTRVEAGIKNTGDGRLWVRGDAAAAAEGLPLDPGESTILNTAAALYLHNAEGTDGAAALWTVTR